MAPKFGDELQTFGIVLVLSAMDSEKLHEQISRQWAAVRAAPIVYIFALAVAVWATWYVAGLFYNSEIQALKSRIDFKDDQIIADREALGGATPAEAKVRIDRLEAQLNLLAPPRLSQDQRAAIAKALSGSGETIMISNDMMAPQLRPLAADYLSAFHAAGWKASYQELVDIKQFPGSGVALLVTNPGELTPMESRVRNALSSIGIMLDIQHAAEGLSDVLILTAKSE